MKVNPIIKFIATIFFVSLPGLIGIAGVLFLGWDMTNVSLTMILIYFCIALITVVFWGVWILVFEDSYADWKKLQEKNFNKRAIHDKEMKRMKDEMEEMRRRLDDRWDSF